MKMLVHVCSLLLLLAGVFGEEYLNCRQHASSLEAMPGKYIPECNGAGNYRVKQCDSSTSYCWCVEPISGEEIEGSRVRLLDPNCTLGSACEQEVANKEVMPGAYIPQCAEDGTYSRVQCHGSTAYCWCAHPVTNEELEGSRKRFEQPECPALPKPACHAELESSNNDRPSLGAYVPQCENDGSYSTLQCHGSTGSCWCVDPETNEEIADTRSKPGEPRPVCEERMLGSAPEPAADADGNSAVRLSVAGLSALCLLLHL